MLLFRQRSSSDDDNDRRVPKIQCDVCGESWLSVVKDGRPSAYGYRRIRKCDRCRNAYPTIEVSEREYLELRAFMELHRTSSS